MFQLVLFAVSVIRRSWGSQGLILSGFVLGLTDMDALTISMARAAGATPASVAAKAVAAGVFSNTLLKLTMAIWLGHGRFRRVAATGLGAMAVAVGLTLLW
jgi:uncharacterized membrane protein (DUF4010 family)